MSGAAGLPRLDGFILTLPSIANQYRAPVIAYHPIRVRLLLNINAPCGPLLGMKHRSFLPALALALFPVIAHADCYADYKAKQDNPLKLHYGVIQLPDAACTSKAQAADAVARRIARDGWSLLTLVSVFGEDGLEQRKSNAGPYFLRY